MQDGLTRLGIAYKVIATLVRGLDYYTRTVSEFVLTDPEYRKSGDIAVAAGGRYDGLVRRMGGPDLSGTGIAGGVDVLYYALRQQGVTVAQEPKADVYVVSGQPDDFADRTQIANPLREAGFTVAIDYSARPLERASNWAATPSTFGLLGVRESTSRRTRSRETRNRDLSIGFSK